MIELHMEQRKDGWHFTAFDGHKIIAEAEIIPVGETAVLHNRIYVFKKSLIPIYQKMFFDIRAILRKSEMKYLMPMSDRYTIKMGKFWRLMGFNFFGSEKKIHYAVMEC